MRVPYVYAHATVTGASSASVPPGGDKAGPYVDKGDQVSPSAAPAAPTCSVPAKATLARVGSVPILTPCTPVDKIRRTSTPSTVNYQVSADNVEAPAAPETMEDHAKSTLEEPAGSMNTEPRTTKNKRKRRRLRKAGQANTQAEETGHHDEWDIDPWRHEEEGMSWPAEAVVSGPPSDSNHSTSQASQVEAPAETAAKTAAAPRPAAKKAAAKPKPSISPSASTSTALIPVKSEPVTKEDQRTPARTDTGEERARAQAAQDNLNRASSASQVSATPRNAPDQDDSLEAALDREIKRESVQFTPEESSQAAQAPQPQPSTTPGAPQAEGHRGGGNSQQQQQRQQEGQQPQQQEGGQQPDQQQPNNEVPRRQRIRTTEEKAAHARYMRFSRSFDRSLDTEQT